MRRARVAKISHRRARAGSVSVAEAQQQSLPSLNDSCRGAYLCGSWPVLDPRWQLHITEIKQPTVTYSKDREVDAVEEFDKHSTSEKAATVLAAEITAEVRWQWRSSGDMTM